ncbi:EAL domain-containing protein [Vibrio sp. SCSIO 43132]|uniref:EAL domain-containing protein n=1 Tax=Vibrio sp. SCSIO 43132 TaxID=2779363 RepID=UPI001CA96D9B|nr:EAL domain-containing protein [Vibrio sp. SCSIO 43132]UAB72001.1 EAL domain-containing protein [Vibrio sp. SCSIO 43132]
MSRISSIKLSTRYIIATASIIAALSLSHFILQKNLYNEHTDSIIEELNKHTHNSLSRQLQLRGKSIALYLSEHLFDPLYNYNLEATYLAIQPALSQREVMVVNVINKDGNVFHDGTEEMLSFGAVPPNQDLIKQSMRKNKPFIKQTSSKLIYIQPISQSGMSMGAVYIELSLEKLLNDISDNQKIIGEAYKENIRSLYQGHFWITFASFAFSLLLATLMARSLTKPIRRLTTHIQETGQGKFRTMRALRRSDEIGELVNAYNDMGMRIEKHTEDIRFMAYHDALTGLPNRTYFISHVNELIQSGQHQQIDVFFIDLDEFKQVNDHFGHASGDHLLEIVSTRLSREVGYGFPETESNMVARLGGDEFLICCAGLSPKQREYMAGNILSTLQKDIVIESDTIVAGGSIGLASYPSHGQDAETLIKNADIAMYHAKERGKNTYSLFTNVMNQKIERRIDIEQELRKALNQPEQFELWYQPKIDMQSGKLLGAEALVRWRHPTRGIIMPDDFIPIAENTDMILPLGQHLIDRACQQLVTWESTLPKDFYVTINLSAKQLYRQDIGGILAKSMLKAGCRPRQLQLEVTESQLIQDIDTARDIIRNLREHGIQVLLDDFGTGYASLSYLQKLQFDGVKIDRSFVSNTDTNANDRSLVEAIVSMANSLGMKTVAEGIETKEQAEYIRGIGCDIGQGFFYSKALPADQFTSKWISQPEATN